MLVRWCMRPMSVPGRGAGPSWSSAARSRGPTGAIHPRSSTRRSPCTDPSSAGSGPPNSRRSGVSRFWRRCRSPRPRCCRTAKASGAQRLGLRPNLGPKSKTKSHHKEQRHVDHLKGHGKDPQDHAARKQSEDEDAKLASHHGAPRADRIVWAGSVESITKSLLMISVAKAGREMQVQTLLVTEGKGECA